MPIQKLAHAELRVTDLSMAVDFHLLTLGLAEIERASGTVYVGCGPGSSYDLALREGGTGVERFALSADDGDDLSRLERTLRDHGMGSARLADPDPGVEEALRFTLPSGHAVELVLLRERAHYENPARRTDRRTAVGAPVDLDHINLRVADTGATMAFLRDALGFRSSDIIDGPDGSPMATWMHVGDRHHDVAMFNGNPGETLDHLAWTMSSLDHVKSTLDRLGRDGIAVETGPGRHGVCGNIYAYFWAPGGNRYELSAEMPRASDRLAPAVRWAGVTPAAFSAWGATPPASFAQGS